MIEDEIQAYWHGTLESPNFGDMITPIIIYAISGIKPTKVDITTNNKILCCGSIIEAAAEGDILWGTGALKETQITNHHVKYTCKMARGLLSRNLMKSMGIECPEFTGTPASLIPFIFEGFSKKKEIDIGIFPHMCFFNEATDLLNQKNLISSHKFFSVKDPVECVINNILQSHVVLTESLHVMIIAEYFGIPSVFFMSNKKHDYDFTWKFRDYNSNTDREFIEPIFIEDDKNIGKRLEHIINHWKEPKKPDYKTMLNLCPFNYRNIYSTDDLIRFK